MACGKNEQHLDTKIMSLKFIQLFKLMSSKQAYLVANTLTFKHTYEIDSIRRDGANVILLDVCCVKKGPKYFSKNLLVCTGPEYHLHQFTILKYRNFNQ